MHCFYFKKLTGWLVRTFEHFLVSGERNHAREIVPVMNAVHTFLRGSAIYPVCKCTAAAKTAAAERFRTLVHSHGFRILSDTQS